LASFQVKFERALSINFREKMAFKTEGLKVILTLFTALSKNTPFGLELRRIIKNTFKEGLWVFKP